MGAGERERERRSERVPVWPQPTTPQREKRKGEEKARPHPTGAAPPCLGIVRSFWRSSTRARTRTRTPAPRTGWESARARTPGSETYQVVFLRKTKKKCGLHRQKGGCTRAGACACARKALRPPPVRREAGLRFSAVFRRKGRKRKSDLQGEKKQGCIFFTGRNAHTHEKKRTRSRKAHTEGHATHPHTQRALVGSATWNCPQAFGARAGLIPARRNRVGESEERRH